MSERRSVLRVNTLESPAWAERRPAPALDTVPCRSPRVAIVSDALPGRNGLDSYYRDLAINLRPHGPQVTLINPDPENAEPNYRWSVPMPGDTRQRICLPKPLEVYHRIRALAPDVIVVPACGPFGYLGAYVAKRLGRPLIAGLHTDLQELARLYWSGPSGWIAKRALEGASRLLFRGAHAVVVNADRMVATANRLGARRTLLMGTSIAPEFASPAEATLAAKLGRIAYAGRLAPEKNLEGLLEAVRRLPHLEFEVAGSGPLQGMVERSARELSNLRYHGLLSRTVVADLIDRCDALVLPSRAEAFGTVALEAMARNRAVIVSPQCGIVRWPGLAAGVFVMEPGETVTDALVRIAALPPSEHSTRARLGRGAALDHHHKSLDGWSHAITRWGGVYHRLHGIIFSRNTAEHLALPRREIPALVCRCHAWFSAHGLPEPDLYVPPAWALGGIARAALAALPFRYYEDLGGILDVANNRHHRLPLLGYQADAPWRSPTLRASNWVNWLRGRRAPVRIAIHPRDLWLPLARQLEEALALCHRRIDHRALSLNG